MALIRCNKVSKHFRRTLASKKLLREHIADMAQAPEPDDKFYALRDVSFELRKGESVGILGRNGAGKSTLLNMICGLTPPDEGTLEVNGAIAALLELGAGFHPDLTGRENLEIYASLVGLTRQQTARYHDEIVDFAELAEMMDEPLRTYSTGMIIRLAFGVAVHQKADLLIVDEVLAVGDAAFQEKCVQRIRKMQAEGMCLLLVSHAPTLVQAFCDSALWLDQGQVKRYGSVAEVCPAYADFVTGNLSSRLGEPAPAPARKHAGARR
jgi:ABC-type polysaccharide/polyol phosphate transport system ATPase subunit